MHLVIFEGDDFSSLAPLSFFRPTFCLRSGASTLLDKQIRFFNPTRLSLWVRPALANYCQHRVIERLPSSLQDKVSVNKPLDDEQAMLCDGRTVFLTTDNRETPTGVKVRAPGLSPADAFGRSERFREICDRGQVNSGQSVARHVWDLLSWNEQSLQDDLRLLRDQMPSPRPGSFHLINESDVLVGDGVKLQPGCVIDASAGPVYLGDGVMVGANAVVLGPCAIGPNSEIAPLATIRPRTSVGPWCKLGGEVSASIIQGYSNKAHDGYLGDSVLGEWVNLGAGTVTSNLKNTYGLVSMHADGQQSNTGRQFLGSLIGDHSKTGIGTRLMTGTYVGVCSMIASSTSPPRVVKSFEFRTDDKTETYRTEKAVEVARAVYARRKMVLTTDDEMMINSACRWAAAVE